jgi:hypothetical protein
MKLINVDPNKKSVFGLNIINGVPHLVEIPNGTECLRISGDGKELKCHLAHPTGDYYATLTIIDQTQLKGI